MAEGLQEFITLLISDSPSIAELERNPLGASPYVECASHTQHSGRELSRAATPRSAASTKSPLHQSEIL